MTLPAFCQRKLNSQAKSSAWFHSACYNPFLSPTPDSLGFIIYDQLSLNETVSKSSFLFHTDNIIFIKLIFQEALFYSDFPEPGEIILFLPLGLKENLSMTNVYQQRNFFCKKLKPPWHSKEKSTRPERVHTKESFRKGDVRLPEVLPSVFLTGQCTLSLAKSDFKTFNNRCSLEAEQSEQKKVPGWIPAGQPLTLSPLVDGKISGKG